MTYYPYETFVTDVKALVKMTAGYPADAIIAIARGGLTLGHAYASATDNRHLLTINSILYEGQKRGENCDIFNIPDLSNTKRVLLLDDIIDSGQTMQEVVEAVKRCYPDIEIKIAALFYKQSARLQADFALHEAHDWIEFFWEKDFKKESS